MADKTVTLIAADGTSVPVVYHDNGDGTYSPTSGGAGTGSSAAQTQGNVAHDGVDSGNPVKIGGKAETTTPAAVSDGDRVDAWFDEYGRLVLVLKDTSGNAFFEREDATNRNIRSVLYNGSANLASVIGNSDTASASLVGFNTRAAMHGFGGSTLERFRTANFFTPVALGAATAEATVWTPTSGKKFRLMGFVLTAGAQTVLTFKDNTGGTTIATVELAANVPLYVPFGNGKLSAAANNLLTVTRGTSATLNGTLVGTEE